MLDNVPDDWGCYWRSCDRCGHRYHASEGGCGCHEELGKCQCGQNAWDDCNDPRCLKCGTGPYAEGRTLSKVHVARREHHGFKPGDTYRRSVTFGHYPGGAFTLQVRRSLIERAA